jgi:hypothetical protein
VAGAFGSEGEVNGGGGEQFELLLVIIDDLEEPSDLVWLWTALNTSTFLISATYFGTVVGRCQHFQGIVVTVVEYDDQYTSFWRETL